MINMKRENTINKKMLFLLLAAVMVLAMLPTTVTAAPGDEQFTLTPGGTYYFDLSAQGIPGTVNTALPDTGLKWVPFIYAGTVNAYSLDVSSSGAASASAAATASDRSLFVADHNLMHTVSWDDLNGIDLIFGKAYTAGGIDYMLRSLSAGSGDNGQSEADMRGTPETNEWDQLLNKDAGFIKNWNTSLSWGQDTGSYDPSYRALRGSYSARLWYFDSSSIVTPIHGFRPALEILNPGTLGSDGLKTVTFDMGGNGTLGSGTLTAAAVVYTGTLTLPEITAANGFTYTGSGTGILGWYDGTAFHAPGTELDSLASGTTLTARYSIETVGEQFTLAPGGTYYFDLSAQGIPGTVNTALPDTGLKWVPFTYAGTVNAYSLDASSIGDASASANATASDRSLFVADYNLMHTVSWENLDGEGLIFGKAYAAGGIDYMLRSLSAGSGLNGQSGADQRGTPETNEWDQLLNKNEAHIKNWNSIYSWGQDSSSYILSYRAHRGASSARYWSYSSASSRIVFLGFRPSLEILNPGTLGSDGLKTVTFDMGGNGTLGSGTLTAAAVVYTGTLTLPEITAANGFTYTGSGTGILGWYDGSGSFYAPGATPALAAGTALTAGYELAGPANGGTPIISTIDSGSSGGGGSSSGTTVTIQPDKKPDQPVMAGFSAIPTVDRNGHATAAISQQSVADAIAKALTDATAQGKTANGIGIFAGIMLPNTAKSLRIVLPRVTLNSLVDAGVKQFEINGVLLSLNLDLEALKEIQRQSTGDVTITITPTRNLSAAAKKLIGARPVYDVTVSYVKDGMTVNITSLGKGIATLSLPYKPNKNEAVGYLFGVYVDGMGNAVRIPGSAYDSGSGSMILGADHFSVYGVGYTSPPEKYIDIAAHWARESIDYAVGRGLFSGAADIAFSPDTAMDRGMLVTVLGRLAGADVSACTTSSFTDVAAGKYYLPYVEWAYKKGIVQGIGNNMFAPEIAVTREEIAVILTNYAKATGYILPVTREVVAFADNSSIGSTYTEAVKAMQQAGIMMGESNNKFNPKAGATRAEVAAMLYRYVKLTIDPATAQGWAKNDDGQWFYYKDGKPLTGWQTIGSETIKKRYYFTADAIMISGKWMEIDGKWYYFYANGSLAVSTKIDGYEVDEGGVRKDK